MALHEGRMVAAICLMTLAGNVVCVSGELGRYALAAVAGLVFVVASWGVVRAADLKFGNADVPCGPKCLGIVCGVLSVGVPCALNYMAMLAWGMDAAYALCILTVPVMVYGQLSLRREALWPSALLLILSVSPAAGFANSFANFTFGAFQFLCSFCLYIHDQRIGMMVLYSVQTGMYIGGSCLQSVNGSAPWISGVMFIVFVYLTMLFTRRRRSLPHALRHCRYVRLSSLRAMLAQGRRIVRSQEMPHEAFGDPCKAEEIVVTSHRWLHRYTCDICTEGSPSGVRLEGMVRRLNAFFPVSLSEVCADKDIGCLAKFSRVLRSVSCGGSDVLIFFDFMALPQIGQDTGGELIPRTPDEAAAFTEALPAMGSLYTMLPVMVIPEVTPEHHPYSSSGWCFSEFSSAFLSRKLDQYSKHFVDEYIRERTLRTGNTAASDLIDDTMRTGSLDDDSVADYMKTFLADLATKRFFDESDRGTVRGIVQGFLIRRLLHDAVLSQQLERVRSLLRELAAAGLDSTLSDAVEERQNTLLHLAAPGSADIVQALLACGADPSRRNQRGDSPSQFFMLPRCRGGARACRQSTQPSTRPTGTAYSPLQGNLSEL